MNRDPERQNDGARPQWVRPPSGHVRPLAEIVDALQEETDRQRQRENLLLGGLICGRGGLLFGTPVVWDTHWPEGLPPGMTAESLREFGENLIRQAGGTVSGEAPPQVAAVTAAALQLVKDALLLHRYGTASPLADTWPQWEQRVEVFLAQQATLAALARGKGIGEENRNATER